MFKKGDAVVQVVAAPISGHVTNYEVDRETGVVLVQVTYLDADGVTNHARYFQPTELAAVPVVATAEA